MRLSWALVHSRRPDDVQRGIAMLEASLSSTSSSPQQMREKSYLLAVRYFRSGDYPRSRQLVERCLEDVLNLYRKELPAMNYAANTGKKSTFLQKCVSNGKFCTLLVKSCSEEGSGEVISAVTYQIIHADSLYAEIPLDVVRSINQHKKSENAVPNRRPFSSHDKVN